MTVDDVEKSDIPLPVLDVKGPAGLDIDPVHKVLYWTDLFTDSISSLTLDVSAGWPVSSHRLT